MYESNTAVTLRDCTLREGLEVPGVQLDTPQKLRVIQLLTQLGVDKFEIVAPGNFNQGLGLLSQLNNFKLITKSGIVAILSNDRAVRINNLAAAGANHIDLLFHVSEVRLQSSGFNGSEARGEHIKQFFQQAIREALEAGFNSIGFGLGDAFRAKPDFLCNLIKLLSDLQPTMFIFYDTVGVALPLQVADLFHKLSQTTHIPLHCHFHNDLGMATANTVVALESGASGADVTIGGLGDRCGNASLEEVTVISEQHLGCNTGIDLSKLKETSRSILSLFGIQDIRRLPIIGDFAFTHSTASHYAMLLNGASMGYEPYPPEIVGQERKFQIDSSPELVSALRDWVARKGLSDSKIGRLLERNQGKVLTGDQIMKELI